MKLARGAVRAFIDTGMSDGCHLCGAHCGLVACPCVYPVPVLCLGCFPVHSHTQGAHAPFPLRLAETLHNKRNYELVLPRIHTATRIKTWLQTQVNDLEIAEKQLEEAVFAVKNAVNDWEKDTKRRFLDVKEQLFTCCEELIGLLDESIAALRPQQLSSLENIDLNHVSNPLKVTVNGLNFREILRPYIEITLNLPKIIQENIISSLNLLQNFPLIVSNSLYSLNFHTFSLKKLQIINTTLSLDSSSSWIPLQSTDIFLCGGRNSLHKVVLYLQSMEFLSTLSDMRCGRFMHCVVEWEGEVFVFGGAGEASQSAERYAGKTEKWRMLPRLLTPKIGAGVSKYENFVYLFGGAKSCMVERLDVKLEVFEQLEAQLPATAWSVVVGTGTEVCILQKDKVLGFDLRSPGELSRKGAIPMGNWWSPTVTAPDHSSVYFLHCSGSVWKFDLPTFSLTKQSIKA